MSVDKRERETEYSFGDRDLKRTRRLMDIRYFSVNLPRNGTELPARFAAGRFVRLGRIFLSFLSQNESLPRRVAWKEIGAPTITGISPDQFVPLLSGSTSKSIKVKDGKERCRNCSEEL